MSLPYLKVISTYNYIDLRWVSIFNFYPREKKMSFIYPKLRGRERTYIKEKVKYMCAKILYDPVDMTD